MLISFCIPTYNRAKLLNRTVESIIQDFDGQDIEIVVSDNASTDETKNIVRDLQLKYHYIRYFQNNINLGLDINAQICMQKALGEYIFTFSDDDVLLKGSSQYIINALKTYQPSFMHVRYRDFNEKELPESVLHRKTKPNKPDKEYRSGFDMMVDICPVHFSSMIFKRTEVFKYLQDLEYFNHNNYERGYTVTYLANYIMLKSPPPFYYLGKCCVAARVVDNKSYRLIYAYGVDTLRQCKRLKEEKLLTQNQANKIINKHYMWHTAKVLTLVKCNNELNLSDSIKIRNEYKGYFIAYLLIYPILLTPKWLLNIPFKAVMMYRNLRNKITGRTEYEYE